MAIFRCKSCGGDLDVQDGVSVIECEYCGNKQTLPKVTDENLQALFNRANFLRQKCDFDKAEKLYEKILEEDDREAEAYWGVILCKFGIEYVKDPGTDNMIPTCHRVSYDSIVADDYYKQAIKYADATQRPVYEADARMIDEIQKQILEISRKEKPYDVFICYKETDANGQRTHDSVMANDIYHQLTNEGFKVFYAAITLEGKLGSDYEAVIFAALNSAKVMLVVGSKPEYFQATWVRNEWSRYLHIMKKDRSRLLIPCYSGMDAYDLPEEFAHLQAQNMGKIGFINDLVRGIKKVIVKEEPKSEPVMYAAPAAASAASASSVAPLLKRAFMFLEDGDFDRADDLLEQVLNQDPENAMAYVGKLMASLRVRRINDLATCQSPFDGNINCKKAMRFGDEELKSQLKSFNDSIRQRISSAEKARVEAANSEVYNKAMGLKSKGDVKSYLDAKALFEKIRGYKDSDAMAEECRDLANETAYNGAVAKMKNAKTVAQCEDAITALLALNGYKDSKKLADDCREKIDSIKTEESYQLACKKMAEYNLASVDEAQKIFESLGDYKDSKARVSQCIQKWLQLNSEKKKQDRANALKSKLGCIIPLLILAGIIVAIVLGVKGCNAEKAAELDDIKALIEAGEYDQAIERAEEIGSAESYALRGEAYAKKIVKLFNDGDIENAEKLWIECEENIPGWNDKYSAELRYYQAAAYTNIGDYAKANEIYNKDLEYEDTKAKVEALRITARDAALTLYEEGKYKEAYDAIKSFEYSEEELSSNTKTIYKHLADGNYGSAARAGLKNVVIPDTVTELPNDTFKGCEELESVTLPNTLTKIGWNAFNGCKSLKSITIPESVTEICGGAFIGCESLTTVKIPSKLTVISDSMFEGCTGLTEMVIPSTVTKIELEAFRGCTSLTTMVVPDSVTEMGSDVFYGCTSLESLTIPFVGSKADGSGKTNFGHICSSIPPSLKIVTVTNATSIAGSAFKNFKTLVTLNLPDTVTTIGSNAFENCYSLTNFKLPSKVKTIGSSAFLNCTSLLSITIPSTLTGIGSEAFKNCYKLVEIYDLSNLGLAIGIESKSLIEKYALVIHNTASAESILFREGDYVFRTDKNTGDVVMLTYAGTDNELKLPALANGSEYSIGEYAFIYNPSITKVVIPASVTSIKGWAFDDCPNLKEVDMSASKITSIEKYAFYKCYALDTVLFSSNLNTIGIEAFYHCKALKELVLPASLMEIGKLAFGGDADLSSVTFAVGARDGWWRSDKEDAASGTAISSVTLADSMAAATALDYDYANYYWKRTVS